MKRYTRAEVRDRLLATIHSGSPVVIAAAGNGLVAQQAERGGADMIGLYHSSYGRWERLPGSGMGSKCNNNDLVKKLLNECSAVVKETPILAGVLLSDPLRNMYTYLDEIKDMGVSAIMSFPTCGIYGGRVRESWEEEGFGMDKEQEMLAVCREKDFFTIGYAFTMDEVRKVVSGGIDAVIFHMGQTKGGDIPHCSSDDVPIAHAADVVNAMSECARSINKDVIIFAHGGPISAPDDTAYIYEHTPAVGFLGASSVERIPVEMPLLNVTKSFKQQKTHQGR